jgi:hypothetical protein
MESIFFCFFLRKDLLEYCREILIVHQAKILLLSVYGLIAFVVEDIF